MKKVKERAFHNPPFEVGHAQKKVKKNQKQHFSIGYIEKTIDNYSQ